MIHLKVYVRASSDIRLARRLIRAVRYRNRTANQVIQQYLTSVRPAHIELIEPSSHFADMIISGEDNIAVHVHELATKLSHLQYTNDHDK